MAKRRKSPNTTVQNFVDENKEAYVAWGATKTSTAEETIAGAKALSNLNMALDEYIGYSQSNRRMRFDPQSVGGGGVSGRYEFTNSDYESWRPNEGSQFSSAKEAQIYSDAAYKKHGLIKNVIDLMGDFGSQGMRLVCKSKRQQKFWDAWWEQVRGEERSERALNLLYRLGTVPIRIQTATLSVAVEREMYKATGAADIDPKNDSFKMEKREIPWRYTFLHPATIEVVGGPLASFTGKKQYAIRLPAKMRRIINSPKTDEEKTLVSSLPEDIKEAAKNNKLVPLEPAKTEVLFYKKDDWEDMPMPIISSLAIDISIYEKLKLADRAALDGAISNIRIFKLGSLEHKIMPTDLVAAKLANILESNTEAGTIDLIWGPDIELIESKTAVHQFLGKGKYEPTMEALYAGLGVPQTLTGTISASGTTNNFISLKTLVERLKYGRDRLIEFWDKQIKIVQKAMGFAHAATIEFDHMNLGDEAADKALLIQLADRNLISDELLQRLFGNDPEMEAVRIKREEGQRTSGKKPPKASAFHDAQQDLTMKKIALQSGVSAPSEVGLELGPKKKGEKNALQYKASQRKTTPGSKKKKGTSGQGRPKNKKDTTKRKTKRFTPRGKASMATILWARATQDSLEELVNPVVLQTLDKKNMRALSSEESDLVEKIKFGVLCNLEPFSNVDNESVASAIGKSAPAKANLIYNQMYEESKAALGRPLNMDERKNIQANAYDLYVNEQGDNNGQG